MVNNLGQWTYVPDTPESEKCDLDRAAEVVLASGYKPREVSLETLLLRLLDFAQESFINEDDNPLYSGENGMLNKDVFAQWLADECIADFDYLG